MGNSNFTYRQGRKPFLTFVQLVRKMTAMEKWRCRKARLLDARRLVTGYRFHYSRVLRQAKTFRHG